MVMLRRSNLCYPTEMVLPHRASSALTEKSSRVIGMVLWSNMVIFQIGAYLDPTRTRDSSVPPNSLIRGAQSLQWQQPPVQKQYLVDNDEVKKD